jgi:hypothetical protein
VNWFYKSRFKNLTSHSNDTWVNNSTVHSVLLFIRHVFIFVGAQLYKSHYKEVIYLFIHPFSTSTALGQPPLPDRVETNLHLGVDVILLTVFQN